MLSDEEKKAIEYWKTHMEILHWNTQLASEYYIKILLNLIEKQQKEIEEYKKQLDLDYVDKHFVPVERYNQLEKEIEELKEGFKIQEHNYQVAMEEIEQRWKDKIKAKIEPVLKQLDTKMKEEYNKYGNSREYQDMVDAYNFLQSLLDE